MDTRILMIAELLSSSYRVSGDWVNLSCPFALWKHSGGRDRHPSFGISFNGYYHCFACGSSGHVCNLGSKLARYGHPRASEVSALSFGIRPAPIEALRIEQPEAIPEGILKLFKRVARFGAINEDSADLFELRYDPNSKAVIFPVRDFYGRLVGIRARVGNQKLELRELTPKPLKRCGIWYGMHLIDLSKPIYLVEGERDAILMWQIGKQAMASLGSPSRQQLEMLKFLDGDYLILFDSDEAGQQQAMKVMSVVKKARKLLLPLGVKDPAEAVEAGHTF